MVEAIRQVLLRVVQTASANERRALFFRLGTLATPLEFVELIRPGGVGERPWQAVPEWEPWVGSTGRYYLQAGKRRPENFRCTALSPSMLLYSDASISGSEKTLVVGVTGNVDRFMMPLCAVLQCFDASSTDVLVIRSSIFKVAHNPPQRFADFAGEVMKQVAGLGAYGRIVALGTSFGGLPAVILGEMLGAERVLAAGAGSPYDPWWIDLADFDPHVYLQSCDYRPSATLLVSADGPVDVAYAREIGDLIPCGIVCLVPGKVEIGHMSLAALARSGDLRGFFEQRLVRSSAVPPDVEGKIKFTPIEAGLRYRLS